MIVAAGFTSEMREVLSKAKGKTFKSYECAGRYGFDTFPGSFRVNLGRFAIDVTLDYHPLDGDPAGFDEPTWFSCEEIDLNSEFVPGIVAEPRQYLVNEVMTGVELVHDRVEYPSDGVVVEADVSLVFRTKYHTFAFSRGIWFSDIIGIEVSGPDAEPQKLASVDELWVEGEDRAVRATREVIML
ncbi:MAG: hypothetical protein IJ111_02660 [Eggerthellaceae bacterium]|nr:hypothetical protein [Eggerthellaceae bacterium]